MARPPAPSKVAARRDRRGAGPRILKKYPNRRLYDTETRSYITLADVKQMVLEQERLPGASTPRAATT